MTANRSLNRRTGYFDEDEAGDWYFVPEHQREAWQQWLSAAPPETEDGNETEWDAWESPPEGVVKVDSPSLYRVTVIG